MSDNRKQRPLVLRSFIIPGQDTDHGNGGVRGAKNPRTTAGRKKLAMERKPQWTLTMPSIVLHVSFARRAVNIFDRRAMDVSRNSQAKLWNDEKLSTAHHQCQVLNKEVKWLIRRDIRLSNTRDIKKAIDLLNPTFFCHLTKPSISQIETRDTC